MIRCDKYREMEEKKFIRLILDGDEDARLCFKEIYLDGLARSVVSRRYPRLRPDIEDIRQDLWVYFTEKNWQTLRNFLNLQDGPNPPSLRPYLYVAISRCIPRHPRYKTHLFAHFVPMLLGLDEENDFNPLERIADPEPGPDRVFENNEAGARIWGWADFMLREVLTAGSPAGLNERELEILRLRCIAKRPSREVAELFAMQTGAVDTALSRAKKKIRDFCDAKGMLNDIREVLRDVGD